MIVYKFYLRDAIKGDIFLSALPEEEKTLEESLESPLKRPSLPNPFTSVN